MGQSFQESYNLAMEYTDSLGGKKVNIHIHKEIKLSVSLILRLVNFHILPLNEQTRDASHTHTHTYTHVHMLIHTVMFNYWLFLLLQMKELSYANGPYVLDHNSVL